MKRFLFSILLAAAVSPLFAQFYHPGEELFYRVSYKAKMFPNTEVGAVEIRTSAERSDGRNFYKVTAMLLGGGYSFMAWQYAKLFSLRTDDTHFTGPDLFIAAYPVLGHFPTRFDIKRSDSSSLHV